MQVSVLGPVGVTVGEESVELGPRLRRLLAALVAADGRVVSTDRLVEMVWDDDSPGRAESTLRSYVTRLRRSLATDRDDLIVHRSPGYVLQLADDELDARLFDVELDAATRHLRLGDVEEADHMLSTALARWRGRAFEELASEDWARPVAVRLEERLVEASELRVEILLALDRADSAVAEAQRLVEHEPLREQPRGLLMRSLYAAGRRVEALRVLGEFRSYLVEETGLDPSDELSELEGRIVCDDPSLGPAVRPLKGYELGERIGEGAFAVVHRAIQPGLEREVAVKVIRSDLANRPEFIRRFEVEARTIARIEHPNVVPLFDFWREPGAAYLVMRYLRGGTVEQALRRRGPFSRDRTVALLDDIGPALEAAHRAGVVHRDIRPANLLLDEDDTAYLADFGIARPAAFVDESPMLSPAYAAPEVIRGEPVGVRADILSLGVTVFEVLTGRLPFDTSTDRAELIRRQLFDPLPPVRGTRTDLPGAIDEVLARATAKAPEDRYASVSGLVEDLRLAFSMGTVRREAGLPVDTVVTAVDTPNPYVGLHAFEEADTDRFHGRNALVTELVEALERQRLTVVVGPSGSGKSSVVRAGLLPAVRRGAVTGSESWFVTTMLPGGDPVDALEAALLRIAVNPPSSLRQQLAEDGGLLRAVRRVLPDERTRILLVVDQFEELFTQVAEHEARDRFLTELAAAVSAPDSPLRVVATLRADHYDAPLRHPAMAELATQGTVTVRPLTPDELGQVIVEPARAVGVTVEPALVAELVAGVAERPAALPLLQFALTEVFDRRVAGVMTLVAHRELGGLTRALATRADRILDEGGDADVAEIRRIFGRLVTLGDGTEDTRRRALRSELGDEERTAWLLSAFGSARLLTFDRDEVTRVPTVEIAHEALLRDWPRLRDWLDEDRTDLRVLHEVQRAAGAWERSGRDDGELARGGRLVAVSELAARRPDWLSEIESTWIDASAEAAEAERRAELETAERDRRQNRRLRSLLGIAALLLVVALVAAVLAVRSQRATARERTENRVLALSLQSEAELEDGDPDVALRLALAAYEDAESLGPDAQRARIGDLHRAVQASRLVEVLSVGETSVDLTPDGRRLVAVDGTSIVVLDRETGAESVRRDLGEVVAGAAVSPDGTRIALTFGDWLETEEQRSPEAAAGLVLDPSTLETVGVLEGGLSSLWPVWDPSSRWIAAQARPGYSRIWDASTGTFVPAGDEAVVDFTGPTEAVMAGAEGLVLLDPGSGAQIASLEGGEGLFGSAIAVSPVSRMAAVARGGDEVELWDLDLGRIVDTVGHPRPDVLRFSPDGLHLAIGGNRDEVHVVDLESSETLVLRGNGGAVNTFSFTPDGEQLLVGGFGIGTRVYAIEAQGPSVLGNLVVDGVVFDAVADDAGDLVASVIDDEGAHLEVLSPDGTRRRGRDFLGENFLWPELDPTGVAIGGIGPDAAGLVVDVRAGGTLARLGTCEFPRAIDVRAGWVLVESACPSGRFSTDEVAELEDAARRGFVSLATGELIAEVPADLDWLGDAVVGPPGTPSEGVVVVHDFTRIVALDGSGGELARWEDLGGHVPLIMAMSPDGARVGSGDQLGGSIVLDLTGLRDGRITDRILLEGVSDGPTHRTSPLGDLIVTSGGGEQIRVWDASTRELVVDLATGPLDFPVAAAMALGDDEILYQDAGGVLRRLILDPDRLAELARSRVQRDLTPEECERLALHCGT